MMNAKRILPLLCAAYLAGCATNQQMNGSSEAPLSIAPSVRTGVTADAMYQLGRYYQGQNRYDKAIEAYKKAIKLHENLAEAHNGLGVIYSKQGKFDEAVGEFNTALQKAPEASHIYNNLGYAHYLQGQEDQSIAAYKQALTLNSENKRAQANLNLVYTKTGNVEAAPQGSTIKPDQASSVAGTELTAGSSDSSSYQLKERHSLQEDSGVITRASDSGIKVVEIAPAIFRLEKQQAQPQPLVKNSRKIRIEVANGNGVNGMAKRVSAFLSNAGFAAARLTNQQPFNVKQSELQYRAGYRDEAEKLRATIDGDPRLIQRDDLRADISIRVLLGKDVKSKF
jgi:Flp pilus assembly protein TadD